MREISGARLRRRRWLLVAVLTGLLFTGHGSFAISSDAGTSGAQFLKIGVGGRASSLGEAYAGVGGDVFSMYWNPAGLASLDRVDVAFQRNNSFVDIDQNFFAVAVPNKSTDGSWGLGINYLDAGDQTRTTEDGAGNLVSANAGRFSASDLAVMASYARPYSENLVWGLAAKYIEQKLEDEKASSWALDFGIIWKPKKHPDWNVGLAVQNVGPDIRFINQKDALPLNFKFGVARWFRAGRVLWVADINLPRDNDTRLNTGIEYWVMDVLAARVGYSGALDDADDGLTLGVGFRYNDLRVDYAFLPFGDLGDAHRISAGYSFGL